VKYNHYVTQASIKLILTESVSIQKVTDLNAVRTGTFSQSPQSIQDKYKSIPWNIPRPLPQLFFSRFVVYTAIFAGWSSNSDYSLLRPLAQTTAYEARLAFILLSFVVLICIHNLVHFYSLPILTPYFAHTAAAFSAISKNYQRKCSIKLRETGTELNMEDKKQWRIGQTDKPWNIVNHIKVQRLSWFGNIQRMPETRAAKKKFKRNPLTTRPRGRPKYTWEDIIQDLGQIKIKNWITCVQDRAKWRRGRRHWIDVCRVKENRKYTVQIQRNSKNIPVFESLITYFASLYKLSKCIFV